MPRLLSSLFAALVLLASSAPAWAGHNSQATLGAGGREVVEAECPPGEVLTGFGGRRGAGIDQIQIVCAAVLAGGSYGAPHPFRDAYGGFGGGQDAGTTCGPNARIAAGRVALVPANNMVGGVQYTCVDRNGGVTSRPLFGGSGVATGAGVVYRDGCNEGLNSGTAGCRFGATADYQCPDESFTGIRVRFDTAVRGIGFLCDVRNPPAPPKVIKSSGHMRPAPGPAVAPMTALAGGWQTVTNQNGHFTVILQITNPNQGFGMVLSDLYVTGQMINSDGAADYNGTLQGVIPQGTRTLHYSYVQPAIKGSGTGQFTLSLDGNSISGSGKAGDVDFTWNGTRAK